MRHLFPAALVLAIITGASGCGIEAQPARFLPHPHYAIRDAARALRGALVVGPVAEAVLARCATNCSRREAHAAASGASYRALGPLLGQLIELQADTGFFVAVAVADGALPLTDPVSDQYHYAAGRLAARSFMVAGRPPAEACAAAVTASGFNEVLGLVFGEGLDLTDIAAAKEGAKSALSAF